MITINLTKSDIAYLRLLIDLCSIDVKTEDFENRNPGSKSMIRTSIYDRFISLPEEK